MTGLSASTFSLAGGQTLLGTGTVEGNLSGSGTVSPGSGAGLAGVLTINGNFTPTGTVSFDVNPPAVTAGTNYDQMIVSGLLDLSGATLLFSGTSGAVASTQLVNLIVNNGVQATVAGTNPAEAAIVAINGNSYKIFYNGGDGNDVVLVETSTPATVYVEDADWSLLSVGNVIADADFGTPGNQLAVFGINAFSTIAAAQAAVSTGGTIIVNGGTYAETISLGSTHTLQVNGTRCLGRSW